MVAGEGSGQRQGVGNLGGAVQSQRVARSLCLLRLVRGQDFLPAVQAQVQGSVVSQDYRGETIRHPTQMNLHFLGRIKFRLERVKAYAVWAQAVMVLDMWLSSRGIPWWVAIGLGLPVFLAIYIVDKKYIYPGESEVSWRDNPAFKKLLDKIHTTEE